MFPAREVQGDQRRRPALGDDHSGLRGLRGASQRLPLALPRNGRREDRGSLPRNSHTFPYQGSKCGITFPELCRIGCHCWRWFLLGFRPLVTLVRMSAVVVVDSPWLSLVYLLWWEDKKKKNKYSSLFKVVSGKSWKTRRRRPCREHKGGAHKVYFASYSDIYYGLFWATTVTQ